MELGNFQMNILEHIIKIQSDANQGKNINVEDIMNIRMKLEEVSKITQEKCMSVSTSEKELGFLKKIIKSIGETNG